MSVSNSSIVFVRNGIYRWIWTESGTYEYQVSGPDQMSCTTQAEGTCLHRKKVWEPTSVLWRTIIHSSLNGRTNFFSPRTSSIRMALTHLGFYRHGHAIPEIVGGDVAAAAVIFVASEGGEEFGDEGSAGRRCHAVVKEVLFTDPCKCERRWMSMVAPSQLCISKDALPQRDKGLKKASKTMNMYWMGKAKCSFSFWGKSFSEQYSVFHTNVPVAPSHLEVIYANQQWCGRCSQEVTSVHTKWRWQSYPSKLSSPLRKLSSVSQWSKPPQSCQWWGPCSTWASLFQLATSSTHFCQMSSLVNLEHQT